MRETATLTDLDRCYIQDKSEDMFAWLLERWVGDSLVSGPKILREVVGFWPDYYVSEEIEEFLDAEDADKDFILTGRPYWRSIRENTEKIVEGFERDFDDVFMYPGVTIEGEEILEEEMDVVQYFTGDGIPAYKRSLIESLAEEYEVTFIDDSLTSHERVEDIEGVEQYLLTEDGVERYG